jgi:ectoine hydroxylase-related dioxygenase (phytanoyl-CoA dioxygenase family)
VKTRELFFRQAGYLVERNVFDPSACAVLAERLVRESLPSHLTTFDSSGRPVRVENATECLGLVDWLRNDRFISAIRGLLGPNVVLMRNRHDHVTFDYGYGLRSQRLHRDGLQWSRSFLTAIIGLKMSCSYRAWPRVVPSSHTWPVSAPPNGGGYWLDEDDFRDLYDQAVRAELGAGDVLFVDPLTFHGAGGGRPTEPRVAWTLAMRSTDELTLDVAANELLLTGEHRYAGQEQWKRQHV